MENPTEKIGGLSALWFLLLLSTLAIVFSSLFSSLLLIFVINIYIFTGRDIMKRFATRPGFHIHIRNFYPDAELGDLVGASYISTTDQVNNFW